MALPKGDMPPNLRNRGSSPKKSASKNSGQKAASTPKKTKKMMAGKKGSR